jgi:hypothetical protein
VSLILLAIAAGVAAASGLVAARMRRGAAAVAEPGAGGVEDAADVAGPGPFEGLPFARGDVVSADREERWLAGALVARDAGRVISVLFVAPEGSVHRAVVVYPAPRHDILWLHPVVLDCPPEPPATLEIEGATLTRRGRIPVAIERLGQGAPRLGEVTLWATYEGGGDGVAVVLCSDGRVHAWAGRRYDAGEYDRLGRGEPEATGPASS